jgi:hypothetical protein
MKINSSIDLIYKAWVEIPQKIYETFGHTPKYQTKSCEISKDRIRAGCEEYSPILE